ncbi:MAG: type B 50S ribosomal protein L31 [Methylacidiphilales bacterium]|nr:type B 50S ribosomal protein L31 [Candidatus Methylacidiphilales bacterium]MDW8349607.1 type B 50S ribosomal protein L31 [Verrucomicrobiae bacterium]
MKKNIHPPLHPVVFVDTASDARFITRSTMKSNRTEVINGVEHYVVSLGISAVSHPFFTGQQKFVDTAGRVEKFSRRYGTTTLAATKKKKNN